ncbi:MAG TPA: class I SAM-dependent methyltransferase [Candidatus Binatia bacterium]|nr:class I SAM-dependent methyltransferase [Candidatus Binatia bacterium]
MSKNGPGNFFDEWSIYDEILAHNYMHHDDIFRDVRRFFADRYGETPFTILDLGCGSARHLAQALQGRAVKRYVGYDISTVALSHAARNLAALNCPVDLRHGDLLDGVKADGEKFDVIFTSFALHHLSAQQKDAFLAAASQTLKRDGTLMLIDTMREDDENRVDYLERYCVWLGSRCATLSPQAQELLFAHVRANDFPESARDLEQMATRAGFCLPIQLNRFRWHRAWLLDRAADNTL